MIPNNITKAFAVAILGVAIVSLSACGTKSESTSEHSHMKSGEHAAMADHKDGAAKHAHGKKVAVEVNAAGYKPDTVMATAGEPVTIVFTRITDEGCGQKIMIPSEGIEKDLPLNEAVEITFTPAKSGNLGFSCGMKMMKGTIVVH